MRTPVSADGRHRDIREECGILNRRDADTVTINASSERACGQTLKRPADRPPIGTFLLLFAAMVSAALGLAALSARAEVAGESRLQAGLADPPAIGQGVTAAGVADKKRGPIDALNAQGPR